MPGSPPSLAPSENGEAPVARNPKACEECRRRKQRCDGKKPCSLCKHRRTACTYRAITRRRLKRNADGVLQAGAEVHRHPSQSADHPPSHPHHLNLPGDPDPQQKGALVHDIPQENLPPRTQIYSSIQATHASTETRSIPSVLQLYYGPSSNFSFMQHLHSRINSDAAVNGGADETNVEDGNIGIDAFNYRGIAFASSALRRDGFEPSAVAFLSHELASLFLQNFTLSALPFLPFLDADRLRRRLDDLYNVQRDPTGNASGRAILLAALAIGALMTEHTQRADLLMQQADADANVQHQNVSMQAVQVMILPNSAYLHLGHAIRMAFAAGLHRDTFSAPKTGLAATPAEGESSEASKTWNMLYFYESVTCLCVGRPSTLSPPASVSSLPLDTFHAALLRLASIMDDARRLHDHHTATVASDMRGTLSLRDRLRAFADEVENSNLGFKLGPPLASDRGKGVMQTSLSCLYYYVLLLLFRPFLILHAVLQREDRIQIPSWLPTVAEASVDAAKGLVDIAEEVFATLPDVPPEAIFNFGFLIESACFVILFQMAVQLRPTASSPPSVNAAHTTNSGYISSALRSLDRFVKTTAVWSVVSAVEQMHAKLMPVPLPPSNIAADAPASSVAAELVPQPSQAYRHPHPQQQQQQQQQQPHELNQPQKPQHQPHNRLFSADFAPLADGGDSNGAHGLEELGTWPADWNWDLNVDLTSLDFESFMSVLPGDHSGSGPTMFSSWR